MMQFLQYFISNSIDTHSIKATASLTPETQVTQLIEQGTSPADSCVVHSVLQLLQSTL